MKFDITKKVSLSMFGEDWKDCYLEFNLPSYGDLKQINDQETTDDQKLEKGIETLMKLFKSGKAISEGKIIDVSKEDLKDLPIQIITQSFQAISGQIDPK